MVRRLCGQVKRPSYDLDFIRAQLAPKTLLLRMNVQQRLELLAAEQRCMVPAQHAIKNLSKGMRVPGLSDTLSLASRQLETPTQDDMAAQTEGEMQGTTSVHTKTSTGSPGAPDGAPWKQAMILVL
eukprot:365630-Chlamydomonas_euryale.AAC.24